MPSKGKARSWTPSTVNLALEVHTCNPSMQEGEARKSEVQGYPQLPGKFKCSLGYIRPSLKKRKERKKKKEKEKGTSIPGICQKKWKHVDTKIGSASFVIAESGNNLSVQHMQGLIQHLFN